MDRQAQRVVFSHARDDWGTPLDRWGEWDREFRFDLDAAANSRNYLCPRWLGPGSRLGADALVADWGRRGRSIWVNPPYSQCGAFLRKAALSVRAIPLDDPDPLRVVLLVPSRTDTRWWHEWAWDERRHQPRAGVQVRLLKGRLRFQGATASAPFPSALVVMTSGEGGDQRDQRDQFDQDRGVDGDEG